MFRRTLLGGVCLVTALTSLPLMADDGQQGDIDNDGGSFVYTMTNATAGNSVMVYRRATDGSLTAVGPVASGGTGTGGGLGSQGALTLSQSNRWLLAVNPGSDDVSVFAVTNSGLTLSSRTPSGGHMPLSVTISGRTVYVLNAGTPNNISGFTLGATGLLTPIPNSIVSLSGPAVGPAQILFGHDGDELAVTEKGTNLIDIFPIAANGVPGSRVTSPSVGMTPFGFAFGTQDRLFVSEAFGGGANASAASSYNLTSAGTLQLISASVKTNQTAACWLVIDPSGRFAYTTNTGSRTVSLYRVSKTGALTLDGRLGATPAGGAIDAAFSGDGRFLSVLTANAASIVTFRIASDGSLTSVNTVTAPPSAAGLAAR